ncbi:hypothetical protein Dimus_007015 [Dionaea muscipula]
MRIKLDRAMGNPEWMNTFGNAVISFLEPNVSDHSAMVVPLGNMSEVPPAAFKFLNCWVMHSQFFDLVRKWIESGELLGAGSRCFWFAKGTGLGQSSLMAGVCLESDLPIAEMCRRVHLMFRGMRMILLFMGEDDDSLLILMDGDWRWKCCTMACMVA